MENEIEEKESELDHFCNFILTCLFHRHIDLFKNPKLTLKLPEGSWSANVGLPNYDPNNAFVTSKSAWATLHFNKDGQFLKMEDSDGNEWFEKGFYESCVGTPWRKTK